VSTRFCCDCEPLGEADGVAVTAAVGETEGATDGVIITERGPEPSGATLRTPGASVGFARVFGVMLGPGRCEGEAVGCGDGETVAVSCGVGVEYIVTVKRAAVRAKARIGFIESLDKSFLAVFEKNAPRER
jgi:hypothetical protein